MSHHTGLGGWAGLPVYSLSLPKTLVCWCGVCCDSLTSLTLVVESIITLVGTLQYTSRSTTPSPSCREHGTSLWKGCHDKIEHGLWLLSVAVRMGGKPERRDFRARPEIGNAGHGGGGNERFGANSTFAPTRMFVSSLQSAVARVLRTRHATPHTLAIEGEIPLHTITHGGYSKPNVHKGGTEDCANHQTPGEPRRCAFED